jgi:hypothetical protein
MKTLRVFLPLIPMMMLFSSGCVNEDHQKPDEPGIFEKMIIIRNDPGQLNQRILLKNEVVRMVSPRIDDSKSEAIAETQSNITFTLRADVDAPEVESKKLMATHVAIRNQYAVVTYNIQGEDSGGMVDVFNVADPMNPIIISQALFPRADINAVDFLNNKIVIVGAAGNYEELGFESPAFAGVLNVNDDMLIQSLDTVIDIASYSANSVRIAHNRIYITSGDRGGLTVLNDKMQILFLHLMTDARSVDNDGENVYLLTGQPGYIHVFNALTGAGTSSFEAGSAYIQHVKSQISVDHKYIYTALNEGGVKIFHKDGTLRQHIHRPRTPEGASDLDHATNSAVVNGTLLLMANGGSGIAVAELNDDRMIYASIVGFMAFTGSSSSNYVHSSGNLVFVASGTGGLKILSFTKPTR